MRVENFALIIAITLNLTLSSVSDAEEMAITPFDHKFLGKDTPYLKDTEWKTRIAKIEAECAPAIIQKRKINFKHDEEYERSRLDKLVFTPSDKIMSFTSSQFTDSKSCDSLAKSRALDLRKMTATLTESFSKDVNSGPSPRDAVLRSACAMKCISSKIITYWGKPDVSGYFESHYLSNENRPEMSLVTGQGMCRHYVDIFNFLARKVFNREIPDKYRPEFRYVSTDDHAFVRMIQKDLNIDAYLDPINAACNFYDVQEHNISVAKEVKEVAKKVKTGVEETVKENVDDLKDWVEGLLKPKKSTQKVSPQPNQKPVQQSSNTCTSQPQLQVYENSCERELKTN